MREILFRGKLKDNGEWIYGGINTDWGLEPKDRERYWIIQAYCGESLVTSESIGQYTGLTDKNGKKIFEGDIIRELDGSMDDIPRLVRWDEAYMEFKCPLTRNHWAYGNNDCSFWLMQSENIEIIGNIHDNPDLLGGEENAD